MFPSSENLQQNSGDDSWTDSNLNRVSVIQFQEETKAEEEEDEEAAAERRVSRSDISSVITPPPTPTTTTTTIFGVTSSDFILQGLLRRATPHPSQLKVMKKGMEDRRNEVYTPKTDEEESLDPQVLKKDPSFKEELCVTLKL